VGAAAGAASATRTNIQSATLEAGGSRSAYTTALRAKHAQALVRGGSSAAPIRGAGNLVLAGGGPDPLAYGMVLRRTHWNKSTYVIRGGGTSRWGPAGQLTVIPKGTQAVPNRRMNVANPRALRRGLRRLRGFAKLAKKVLVVARKFKKSGVSPVRRTRKR
jgi:hypothetical protein